MGCREDVGRYRYGTSGHLVPLKITAVVQVLMQAIDTSDVVLIFATSQESTSEIRRALYATYANITSLTIDTIVNQFSLSVILVS